MHYVVGLCAIGYAFFYQRSKSKFVFDYRVGWELVYRTLSYGVFFTVPGYVLIAIFSSPARKSVFDKNLWETVPSFLAQNFFFCAALGFFLAIVFGSVARHPFALLVWDALTSPDTSFHDVRVWWTSQKELKAALKQLPEAELTAHSVVHADATSQERATAKANLDKARRALYLIRETMPSPPFWCDDTILSRWFYEEGVGQVVIVTLANRKVYVGFLAGADVDPSISFDRRTIILIPFASCARNSDTLRIGLWDTRYPALERFLSSVDMVDDVAEPQPYLKNDDVSLVIRQSDIETIGCWIDSAAQHMKMDFVAVAV